MWVERTTVFDVVTYVFLSLLSASFLYPLVSQLAISVSDPLTLGWSRAGIIPKGFTLDAYGLLLSDGRILRYYANTIMYAVGGTAMMLLSTSLMAYPLTFRDFRGRKLVTILLTITMFFSGGLVPLYITVLRLGLVDTIWALILPNAVAAWNVVVFRTFFHTIPDSLRESAQADGAGHFTVLFRIILPLSKPLLATFTLFSVVGYWNDYFWGLVFLRHQDKQPVQLFLRRILVLLDFNDVKTGAWLKIFDRLNSRTVKGAAVIITITPILCVYPFLQRHFAKGILVGAIKD
jgi:putative aldouronate transport system permease protein